MFNVERIIEPPIELERPELRLIEENGYTFDDPFDVVALFEQKVANFAGSKFAVAVDSCSNGLFLSLKYLQADGVIRIPKYTYISVPMQIKHAGCEIQFNNQDWVGKYQLAPYPVWDSAAQWRPGMYEEGLQVISFQYKKPVPIGRGGMILTNDEDAYQWLISARHDGRDMSEYYPDDEPTILGWHYYMTPEDAARGILLMDALPNNYADLVGSQVCIDISQKTIFGENNA